MSNDSRVVLPNLEIANQIQATGIALINVFAQDLFDFIDRGLQKTRGANWLTEMQIQNVGSDLNFKDPSILLKELSQKGQSPLREPIRSIVPQNHWKDFYKRLEELLGERHVWVHNAINADPTQLKSLVVLVSKISWALELPTVQECTKLLEHIDPEENSVAVEAPEPTSEPSELVSTVEKYMTIYLSWDHLLLDHLSLTRTPFTSMAAFGIDHPMIYWNSIWKRLKISEVY
jgi:hypothetical protein